MSANGRVTPTLHEDYRQRVTEIEVAVARAARVEQEFLEGKTTNREANAACSDLLHRRRAFAVWLMDNHAALFASSEKKAIGWIPVSERLPEDNRTVLAYGRNPTGSDWRETVSGKWLREAGHNMVTHWMPLPEAPK